MASVMLCDLTGLARLDVERLAGVLAAGEAALPRLPGADFALGERFAIAFAALASVFDLAAAALALAGENAVFVACAFPFGSARAANTAVFVFAFFGSGSEARSGSVTGSSWRLSPPPWGEPCNDLELYVKSV
jgi:hypothetical protein